MSLRYSILFLAFFVSSLLQAQSRYKDGYYITNNGETIECLIRDENWLASPKRIRIKNNQAAEVRQLETETLLEFGIRGGDVYKKTTSPLILASNKKGQLDETAEFNPEERTVMVKQLFRGDIALYEYFDQSILNYLIQVGDAPMEVLRYKKYSRLGYEISENNQYRNQLLRILPCPTLNIQALEYKAGSIIEIIQDYKRCTGQSDIAEDDDVSGQQKGSFNFKIWGGVQATDFQYVERIGPPTIILPGMLAGNVVVDFEDKVVPKAGVGVEKILGFNNNKWSAFATITYMQYQTDKIENIFDEPVLYEVKISRIENYLGLRHYMFLSPNSSVFLEAGPTVDLDFNSFVMGELVANPLTDVDYEVRQVNLGAGFGVGYSLNQTYYLRANYFLGENILSGFREGNELSRLSFLFGIKL